MRHHAGPAVPDRGRSSRPSTAGASVTASSSRWHASCGSPRTGPVRHVRGPTRHGSPRRRIVRLVDACGTGFALELLLTGEAGLRAAHLRPNMVNRVVPHDELSAPTERLVAAIFAASGRDRVGQGHRLRGGRPAAPDQLRVEAMWGYALCAGNPSVAGRSQEFFSKTDRGRAARPRTRCSRSPAAAGCGWVRPGQRRRWHIGQQGDVLDKRAHQSGQLNASSRDRGHLLTLTARLGATQLIAAVCLTSRRFGFGSAVQAIQHTSEDQKRPGQVGPVPVGVGGAQLPPDRHRLLRHRQRLSRAAQLGKQQGTGSRATRAT